MVKKSTIAKIIRSLSIPPIMVTTLITIIAFTRKEFFNNIYEIFAAILFLGILPVMAYPLQKIIPAYKDKGREGQRNLAFLFTLAGYTIAIIWALTAGVTVEVLLICLTYFISVVILSICNKVFHFRASGHACSFTGPLVLLIYFISWTAVIPCLIAAGLIIWSSLALKRHKPSELAAGIAVCLLSFGISLLLITLI